MQTHLVHWPVNPTVDITTQTKQAEHTSVYQL